MGLRANYLAALLGAGSSSTPALTLGFDAATPEQISIRAPLARTIADGTTVLAEYKLPSSGTWLSADYLFRVDVSTLPGGAPAGIVNAFAGVIFDLTPGTTYDVRLTVNEPGQPTATVVGTRATRALPPAAGAVTKTATPATFAAQLLTLVPGDVLELANGTYGAFTLSAARSGTESQPIYIRGASRAGVVVNVPTGIAIAWAASHTILENMTLQGSGVDSGTAATSLCIIFSTGLSTPQTNPTIRNITANGFDRFCKAFEPVNGRLVYNCTIVGNNVWADTTNPPVNDTWNDDGVSGPGDGTCFFDCTIQGHGDTLKMDSSSGIFATYACFMYRIACDFTGDDLAELDDATGNLAVYDCYVKNAATGMSVDNIYGGPVYYFRNRVGNLARHSIKATSSSSNVAVYSNTWVRPAGQDNADSQAGFHNFYSPGGANRNWRVKNNLIVWRSATGDVVRFDFQTPGLDWNYNATFPPTGRNYTLGSGRGSYTGLTAAKAGNAPLMANDIATVTNPFAATVTMGANWITEYTGTMDWTLDPAATVRNAGVSIPGITTGFTGAAPDIGAIITGRPVAPTGDASAIPAWIAAQPLNTWGTVPGNTLSAVDAEQDPAVNQNFPSPAPWRGSSGTASVMNAWCSAALDQSTGRLHIPLGQGHNDGSGNEGYRLDLAQSTPAWTRRNVPSGSLGQPAVTYADGQEATGQYSDGRPRAQHTYAGMIYADGRGPVIAAQIAMATTGGKGPDRPVLFDPNNYAQTFLPARTSGNGNGVAACYDAGRDAMWRRCSGTTALERFDFATSTWAAVGAPQGWNGQVSLVHMGPTYDLILIGNGDSTLGQSVPGGWCVFDCTSGVYYFPTFSIPASPSLPNGLEPGRCQPVWVPDLGCALAWDHSTDRTGITTLTPGTNPLTDTWTVGTLTVDAGNTVTPTAAEATGTYGRFFVWKSARIAGVVNAINQATYFFRY